ncbi:MAG TPA: TerC family protein [bacterium]|nr:TerC family protein [bacterium]
MLEIFSRPESWISLLTLTAMEIVLGIDNIVFISILVGKLHQSSQDLARRLGIALALVLRLGLVFAISWIMRLTAPLFSLFGRDISGRDLILLGGGLFLMAKATHEIHDKLEVKSEKESSKTRKGAAFGAVLAQILALDIVFSLDSVITAVGMAPHVAIMVVAMVLSVLVMLVFSGGISRFVNRHPSMKILALSFLLLIGVLLVAEGMGQHVNKGYIYFAMAFSLGVELLNLKMRKNLQQPVTLHGTVEEPKTS